MADVGRWLMGAVALALVTVVVHLFAPQFKNLIAVMLTLTMTLTLIAVILALYQIMKGGD